MNRFSAPGGRSGHGQHIEDREEIEMTKYDVDRMFLETYKSDCLLELYRNGQQVNTIASEHNISVRALVDYFSARYGKKWRRSNRNYTPLSSLNAQV